ncbi:type VI secretion system-associated protein TagO [Celeribacter halophilus]|uniref:type VI secretion system-associated protein TagO n=1 Tax=Celeribacter halophilus TaxID=576117 RepID=UPI003A8EC677
MPKFMFRFFSRFDALFSWKARVVLITLPFAMLSTPATANWVDVSQEANSIQAITTHSEKPVPGLFDRSAPAELTIRCAQNNTSIALSFEHTYLSDLGDYANVTLQLDDGFETIVELTRGENPQTLVWPDGRRAVPFLIEALRANTLQVSLTSFTDETLTADFSLDGISTAIMPVRSACNW